MSRTSPAPSSGPADEVDAGRVIVITWPMVVLPVAVAVVIVAGFLVGRSMAGGQSGGAPAAVAAATPLAWPAGGGLQPPAGAQDFGAAPPAQDPASAYDPDTVYDLPRRPHPLLGKPAPDFTVKLLATGEPVSLGDYKGRPVLLDFWATWCPPCRYEMPWFQELHDQHSDDGLEVLAFDVGEKVPASLVEATIQQFVAQFGLTFDVLFGEENFAVQRDYSVMGYPSAFLIDREGVVVDFHQGMFPNLVTLQSRVNAILPEGAATAAEGVAPAAESAATPPAGATP